MVPTACSNCARPTVHVHELRPRRFELGFGLRNVGLDCATPPFKRRSVRSS